MNALIQIALVLTFISSSIKAEIEKKGISISLKHPKSWNNATKITLKAPNGSIKVISHQNHLAAKKSIDLYLNQSGSHTISAEFRDKKIEHINFLVQFSDDQNDSNIRISIKNPPHLNFFTWTLYSKAKSATIRTSNPYFYLQSPKESFVVSTPRSFKRRTLVGELFPPFSLHTYLAIDPYQSDADQIAYEPKDQRPIDTSLDDSAMALPAIKQKMETKLFRSNSVKLYVRSFKETFSVKRQELYSSPEARSIGTGVSLEYFFNPRLQFAALIDTHASDTEYVEAASDAPSALQKRLSSFFGPRIDTLNLNRHSPNASLYLGPAFGFHQVPLTNDNQIVYDLGFSLGWQWLEYGLGAEIQGFGTGSRILNMHLTSPWGWQEVFPFIGIYDRNLIVKDDSNRGNFQESGAKIGIAINW